MVGKNTSLNAEPDLDRLEPRFGSKFSQMAEPDLESGSWFAKKGREPD